MRIRDCLDRSQKASLRTEMELFLAHLLGCSRLDLLARDQEELPVEFLAPLQQAWVKLQQGYPVAYLTHHKEFYGLDFYVDERVLIPRWETEQLVDWVLEHAKGSFLELGTGSGAISIAALKQDPELKGLATDVSAEALEVARKNASTLGVELEFIESDLLGAVPQGEFDVIVANLPYIGVESNHFISEEVAAHEPDVALYGGTDGLQLYKRLFEQIREQGREPRFIFGEMGFTQGEAMQTLFEAELSTYRVEIVQDRQGLDRYFIGRKA